MPEGYIDAGKRWYYILHPRPVYILVAEHAGRVNFMAASWVSPFSEDPPRITVSLEKEALTTELIETSGLFTVNVYTADAVDFVYAAGTTSGRRVDKVRMLGARLARDTRTGVPRIAEPRPVGVIEAKVFRVFRDLAEDVDLVVADVVAAYADEKVFNVNYGWILQRSRILMHAAGRAFTAPGQLIVARRGKGVGRSRDYER